MSELEKREVSVRSVIERGNALSLQGHPASKTISRYFLKLFFQVIIVDCIVSCTNFLFRSTSAENNFSVCPTAIGLTL